MKEPLKCHGCGGEMGPWKKKWCSGRCASKYTPKPNKPQKEMRKRMLTYYANMFCIGKMNFDTVQKRIAEL